MNNYVNHHCKKKYNCKVKEIKWGHHYNEMWTRAHDTAYAVMHGTMF
jgi:hypothetical protein